MLARARRDGAAPGTMEPRYCAREAGASPQARWVCCSAIDGGTTRFARDCQSSASALWTHGWSTASVRRHGTIERSRCDGATPDTMTRRCRQHGAVSVERSLGQLRGVEHAASWLEQQLKVAAHSAHACSVGGLPVIDGAMGAQPARSRKAGEGWGLLITPLHGFRADKY